VQAVVTIDDRFRDERVNAVMPTLYDRAERLLKRQDDGDHLYLFLTTRLFLLLVVQSVAAFRFLAQRKSKWEAWLEASGGAALLSRVVCRVVSSRGVPSRVLSCPLVSCHRDVSVCHGQVFKEERRIRRSQWGYPQPSSNYNRTAGVVAGANAGTTGFV
jgi:hypothetical protein